MDMALISLRGVGVLTPRPLFQNLSFNVGPGDRIGLVAGNGGGKSTLLRCIAGLATPDMGSVTLSRGLRVGYVEQDVPDTLLGLSLHEAVRRALPSAEREHEAWRVGAVLDEFETPDELRDRPVAALSGGWQRLALLARVWVTQPDALLLDEPTNHLDGEKIAVLEAWINGPAARTPTLIASHDRSFLDACTTRTLFLRPGASRFYAHHYSRARPLLADDDAAQDRKHAKDAKEVDRLRRNAGELRNVGVNSGSDLLQKKSMQLRDRAEKLEQTLRPAHTERPGAIRLASRGTHAKVLAAFRDAAVAAPDGRRAVPGGQAGRAAGRPAGAAGPQRRRQVPAGGAATPGGDGGHAGLAGQPRRGARLHGPGHGASAGRADAAPLRVGPASATGGRPRCWPAPGSAWTRRQGPSGGCRRARRRGWAC